jgi:hypothetical protein
MKLFELWHPIPGMLSRSRFAILASVRDTSSLAGVLVLLVVALSPGLAQAAARLPPGVHVDPGSPAAKEYAIPLSTARQTGAEHANASPALFGAGIEPPHGPSAAAKGAHSTPGRISAPAKTNTGVAFDAGSTSPSSRDALPSAVLAASARAPSDGASLLVLVGGGVAIVVLGGLAAVMLRRRRRPIDIA